MSELGKVALICLVLIGAGVIVDVADTALGWGLMPWHVVKVQVASGNAIIEKTYDPDRAMSQYTWFKQTYEDIQASQKNIDAMQADIDQFKIDNGNMSTWDYTTKQIYSQKETQKVGQVMYYNNLVAQYTAACNDATKNIYLNGLPARVDKKVWT